MPPTSARERRPGRGAAAPSTGQVGHVAPEPRRAPPRRPRSGRAGRRRAAPARPAWPALAAYSAISAATSSAGGLETTTTSSTAGSASRRRSASRVDEPADLGGQVAAADAERGGDADAGVVEQREQLLAAGAGRGDDADRPGRDGVGEAEAEAADDRGAAVGAHDQQAALGGGPLERDLLLERHVVAEDHHVAAGVEGVHRLDEGARAGHRDQRERRRGCGAGRAAVVRGGAGRPRRRVRRGGARRAAPGRPPARRRSRSPSSVEPERDDHVVGGRRRRAPRSPSAVSTSTLSGGGHRDLGGQHAGDALHVAADLEQRHRVGVGAGSQLDVVGSCGAAHAAARDGVVERRASGRRAAARRRRCAPTAAGPRRAAGSSAVPSAASHARTRAAPRRAARSRAASRTAGWCGAARRAHGARRPSGVATPAARCSASQPQSTSSPSGVRPVAPAEQAVGGGRRSTGARASRGRDEPGHRGRGGGLTVTEPAVPGPVARDGGRARPRSGRSPARVPSRCSVPLEGTPHPARSTGRRGPDAGARSAQGTCAAPAADHADAPAVDVDVDARARPRCSDRSGPSGAAAQPVAHAGRGADATRRGDHASRR